MTSVGAMLPKLRQAYEASERATVTSVARAFDLPYHDVRRALHRDGVAIRPRRGALPAIPDEQLPGLKRAYEVDMLSISGVSARFGLPFAQVHRALKRAGAKLRPSKRVGPDGKPKLRRFETWSDEIGTARPLNGYAVLQGVTKYPSRVVAATKPERVLKSGVNNPKIGARVTKGAWKGFPVYTLTLEERKTCPRSCHHWRTCYGSSMNFSERLEHGPDLERRLDHELWLLQARHPAGYVVRLHVLGDFYSPAYVARWMRWLDLYPALHVFGYTAWAPDTPIGRAVKAAATARWDRFAIRHSVAQDVGGDWPLAVTAWHLPEGPTVGGAVVCPAQTGRSSCCSTCTLCWATRKSIAFIVH